MKKILLTLFCSPFFIVNSCNADAVSEIELLKKQIAMLQQQISNLEKKLQNAPTSQIAQPKSQEYCVVAKNETIAAEAPKADKNTFQIANTKVTLNGFVKLTGIHDFDGSTGCGSDTAASGRNSLTARGIGLDGSDSAPSRDFHVHAKESRLGFTTETNVGTEKLTTCIEADFLGDPASNQAIGNGYNFRLRKALAKYKGFTIGQDFTTFANLDTAGETVDSNGPVGHCKLRQVLARYTKQHNNCTFDIALESPETEFITEDGVLASTGNSPSSAPYFGGEDKKIKGENRLPDLVAAAKYAFQKGYVRLAALLKQNTVYDKQKNSRSSAGAAAISTSFLYNISDADRFIAQLGIGSGCGRYFIDALNTSTYYDGSSLHNQKEYHLSFGLRHQWTKKYNLRTNIGFGYLKLDNSDTLKNAIRNGTITPTNGSKISKELLSWHANLMADLNEKITIGIEYIFAKRKAESGAKISAKDVTPVILSKDSGKLQRITFCAQFNL